MAYPMKIYPLDKRLNPFIQALIYLLARLTIYLVTVFTLYQAVRSSTILSFSFYELPVQ